jgi:hypothetical protein
MQTQDLQCEQLIPEGSLLHRLPQIFPLLISSDTESRHCPGPQVIPSLGHYLCKTIGNSAWLDATYASGGKSAERSSSLTSGHKDASACEALNCARNSEAPTFKGCSSHPAVIGALRRGGARPLRPTLFETFLPTWAGLCL